MTSQHGYTREEARKLRTAYNKAVREAKTEFTFGGRQYLVSYTKYLLEYLTSEGVLK